MGKLIQTDWGMVVPLQYDLGYSDLSVSTTSYFLLPP